MAIDYDKADRLLSMKTVQRDSLERSRALAGDDSEDEPEPKKKPKAKPSDNVVTEQLEANREKQAYEKVFSKVTQAAWAAQQACQKRLEGVELKKSERDAILTECINDLISVLEDIRDDRKSIIAAKDDPSEASTLLP